MEGGRGKDCDTLLKYCLREDVSGMVCAELTPS